MTNMENLVSEFSVMAGRIEHNLSDFLALVAGGCVPTKANMESFEYEVESLRGKYTEIKELAESALPARDALGADVSVSVYASLFEKNKVQQTKLRIEKIEDLLKRFLSVKSLVVAYEEELCPFQQRTKELLQQIQTVESISPEEMEHAAEPQRLFFEAFDFDREKLNSAKEFEEIMDKLETLYSAKVQLGLTLKKYYIHEGTSEPVSYIPVDAETLAEAHAAEHEATDARTVPQKQAALALEEKNRVLLMEPTIAAEPEQKMVFAIHKIKNAAPSASSFKKEILKMPLEIRTILPMLTNLGALCADQIYEFGTHFNCFVRTDEKKASVYFALEKLASKSIIADYCLEGLESIAYCLTPYGYACMNKNTIAVEMRSFWRLSYGKHSFLGENEITKDKIVDSIFHNAMLLRYISAMKGQCNTAEFTHIQKSITWTGKQYAAAVFYGGKCYSCTIVSQKEAAAGPAANSHILIIPDDAEVVNTRETTENFCFMLCGSDICKWDNGWQAQGVPQRTLENNVESAGADVPDAKSEDHRDEASVVTGSDNPAPVETTASTTLKQKDDPTKKNPEEKGLDVSDPIEDVVLSVTNVILEAENLSEYGITDEMEAKDLAQSLLDGNLSPEHYHVYQSLVEKLIAQNRVTAEDDIVENSIAQALVLAKALTFYSPAYQDGFERLLMAVDSPIQEHHYSGNRILTLFENGVPSDDGRPVLKLMALLRALFAPEAAYDYSLKANAKALFDSYESSFEGLFVLKPLYNLFLQIDDFSANGFSIHVLRTFGDKKAEQDLLSQIKNSAQQMIGEPTVRSGLKSIIPMLTFCFGPNSELRECMEIVAEDRRIERAFVEQIYQSYCETGSGETVLSEEKMADYFETQWKKAIGILHGPRDLVPGQKIKIIDNIRGRLSLVERWLQMTESEHQGMKITPQLQALRHKILAEIDEVLPRVKKTCTPFNCAIVEMGLGRIREKLNGRILETTYEFVDFLRTGTFCVDSNCIPYVDDLFSAYKYYEPWRNALRHIASPVVGLRKTLEDISNSPNAASLYDNVGQAVSICKYLNEKLGEQYRADQYSGDIGAIKKSAKNAVNKFKGELELAFARGRISESVKEDILEGIDLISEKFNEYQDYGCLRAFLRALGHTVDDAALVRLEELKQDVETRMRANQSEKLAPVLEVALAKLNEPERNFVVAEEYVNRYDAGISGNMDISNPSEDNAFLEFVGDSFENLYSLCRRNASSSLRSFAPDYIEHELKQKKVSAQYYDSSRALVRSMPNVPENATPVSILAMLKELGFDAANAKMVQTSSAGSSMVRLSVEIRPDAKDKAEYAHPVDIMGTKLKSPVDVVCLFGRMQANDIVDRVCNLELSRTAIVFLNGALDLQGRRQIAERFHRGKSGQNPFLLIDWVLLLHLALYQKTERIPVLLSCSLPYTSSFQPFVMTGSVSDEMFIGRKKELNQILDPKGPVIVYGGRQLGKTALLERASSRANHPDKKEYAVLVRAAAYSTEEVLVLAITQELNSAGITVPKTTAMRALCQHLRDGYNAKTWTKLLLLIDEADIVLDSFRKMATAYGPIMPLSDLARDTGNDFKFVFAGLHNVCRAAADPNTIFGQLGSALCIKPLSAADALALLSRPLRYMGFAIDAAHLEHILVNTSFYPGIVHYVGYSLVENLSTRYADYYQASRGNPPYDLTDKQLGEIMSDDALNEKINERIRWTLQVDPRYFMLARCIAYLYYDNPENNKTGHAVDSLMEYAYLLEISCLDGLNCQEYMALLQELVEMGILVQPTEGTYRLRQHRFLDAIGSSREKIESDIRIAEGGGKNA